jgi:hypothetical protein
MRTKGHGVCRLPSDMRCVENHFRMSPDDIYFLYYIIIYKMTFFVNVPRYRISWLQIQRSRVQFLSSSESGTWSTQPREDNSGATEVGTKFRRQVAVAQSVYFACGLKATEFVCLFVCLLVGLRTHCGDHVTSFYPQTLALTSRTSGGLSVGIVHLPTRSHGVCLLVFRLFWDIALL